LLQEIGSRVALRETLLDLRTSRVRPPVPVTKKPEPELESFQIDDGGFGLADKLFE
jgi:hypothetical protein